MTESNLVQVDNETLKKEFDYFKSIVDSMIASQKHEGKQTPLR
jgi:hypothetical protein